MNFGNIINFPITFLSRYKNKNAYSQSFPQTLTEIFKLNIIFKRVD